MHFLEGSGEDEVEWRINEPETELERDFSFLKGEVFDGGGFDEGEAS